MNFHSLEPISHGLPGRHNGLRNSYARCALLVITIVMFGLCTAHVYLYTKFFTIQFPTLSSDPESFNPEWLVAECDRLQVITMILRRIAVSFIFLQFEPEVLSDTYSTFSATLS